jgi:hypothetical protein
LASVSDASAPGATEVVLFRSPISGECGAVFHSFSTAVSVRVSFENLISFEALPWSREDCKAVDARYLRSECLTGLGAPEQRKKAQKRRY